MPPKKRRSRRKKNSIKKHHIVLILLLIVAGVLFFFNDFGREEFSRKFFNVFSPEEEIVYRPVEKPEPTLPEIPEIPEVVPPEVPNVPTLPKIALIMDDLGNNRKSAAEVLSIKIPMTFSILPQLKNTAWIADEGSRLGHDIMVHLPMQATRPMKLGVGGLYTHMSESEIISVLNKDIASVPHIIGASNHMGSAFTQDERLMKVVISELIKHRLIFLDSLTTSKSVGFRIAAEQGLQALSRDVFLDNTDEPAEIMVQWKRALKIAKKNGRAIVLAHPKKHTLEFLKKTVEKNKDVEFVPISKLIID